MDEGLKENKKRKEKNQTSHLTMGFFTVKKKRITK